MECEVSEWKWCNPNERCHAVGKNGRVYESTQWDGNVVESEIGCKVIMLIEHDIDQTRARENDDAESKCREYAGWENADCGGYVRPPCPCGEIAVTESWKSHATGFRQTSILYFSGTSCSCCGCCGCCGCRCPTCICFQRLQGKPMTP